MSTSPLSSAAVADTLPPSQRPLYIAVSILHGRDSAPVEAAFSRENLLRYQFFYEGRPVLLQPFYSVGDEYARGRNGNIAQIKAFEQERNVRFHSVFWVDDDVIVPIDAIQKLLAHNVPIASGLYVMRKAPHFPVAYTKVTDPDCPDRYWNLSNIPDHPTWVDAAGQGCVLISREVYDRVPEPYYAWRPVKREEGGSGGPSAVHIMTEEEEKEWSEGGKRVEERTLGEDLYFFTRAAESGYRVLLDPSVDCGHIGSRVFTSADFRANQQKYFRYPPAGRLSVLFLPVPAPKPWTWSTLEREGLGGSESAVAYLAHELANRHHHVVTVCSGNSAVTEDGVDYRPATEIQSLLSFPWDVVVVSRWMDILPHLAQEERPNLKLVVSWLHDLISPQMARPFYTYSDVMVALTNLHYRTVDVAWPENDANVLKMVLPNGVDLPLFDSSPPPPRQFGKLIWTSNPNRGLPSALRLFREIRKRHPGFELHVYGRASVYGWGPMEEAAYLPDPGEPGVFVHDPLPKAALAQELRTAWAWFYPSHWPETFSIAALEAQAAGTPVLCSPYGALLETVQGGIVKWDLLEAVEELLDEEYWELLSLKGKEFARSRTWSGISDQWDAMFRERLAFWAEKG